MKNNYKVIVHKSYDKECPLSIYIDDKFLMLAYVGEQVSIPWPQPCVVSTGWGNTLKNTILNYVDMLYITYFFLFFACSL